VGLKKEADRTSGLKLQKKSPKEKIRTKAREAGKVDMKWFACGKNSDREKPLGKRGRGGGEVR